MNEYNFSSRNATTRRTYFRRKGKGNRTTIASYLPVTTAFVTTTTNQTLINVNPTSVPVNDLFAPLSYFIQHKFIFFIVSSLLLLLCVLTICFLIVLKCSKESRRTRQQKRLDKKRLEELPDFLDDQNDHKDETDILLEPTVHSHSLINTALPANGTLSNDNISTTFSIDPLVVQKINQNNLPNAAISPSMADNTSVDTLRGSVISSPSQKISAIQPPSTPTPTTTTTDSVSTVEDRVMEAERGDEFQDIVFTPNAPRFQKANNGNHLSKQQVSTSSSKKTIREEEKYKEEEERKLLHGSATNIMETTMEQLEKQKEMARKQHTKSQTSLVSRTSEDSCY